MLAAAGCTERAATESAAPGHIPAAVTCQWARVRHVSDGDTIRVDIETGPSNQPVRYIGIDTPEIAESDALAEAARVRNIELVGGKRICLERDVSDTDRFGRLLRNVWLDDGTFVNEALVHEGLAVLLTIPPDIKYADRLGNHQRDARDARRGVWSD